MAYDFLTSSQEKKWHIGDESSLPKTCVIVGADQGVNPCYATGDMLDRMPDKMSLIWHALALVRTYRAHLLSGQYNTRMLLSASLDSLSQKQCNFPVFVFLYNMMNSIFGTRTVPRGYQGSY